jgi:hypothetical protein
MRRWNYHSCGMVAILNQRKWTVMNQYAAIAETHFRTHLPDQYAQMSPSQFAELGQRIEDQIDETATELAGDDPADETFISKLGRLNMARLRAREMVLAEMLPEPLDAPEMTPAG